MKKFVSLLLALLMVLSLTACGQQNNEPAQDDQAGDQPQTPAETVELTVFAAASLTESLTAIGEKYMAENENVKLSFNFDSSGKLYTQITEGAPCDLFISAAPKQMNQLDGTLKDDADKNPDGLDMLVEGSRIDLLENKVVLAVAEGNDKGIDSFDKLAELLAGFDGPILWVSHDLGECYRNCRSVCVMENGQSGAVTDMETLVRHPATPGAARLAGCRNFLSAHSCPGGVKLDGWDITLPFTDFMDLQETVTVAIPDDAVVLRGDTPAVAERIIRDIHSTVVLLQPQGVPDAQPLRAVLPEGMTAEAGQQLTISLLPEKCLCHR